MAYRVIKPASTKLLMLINCNMVKSTAACKPNIVNYENRRNCILATKNYSPPIPPNIFPGDPAPLFLAWQVFAAGQQGFSIRDIDREGISRRDSASNNLLHQSTKYTAKNIWKGRRQGFQTKSIVQSDFIGFSIFTVHKYLPSKFSTV